MGWACRNILIGLIVALVISCAGASRVLAADETARTVDDPTIPVEELELMLTPLTKGELEVEAAGWIDLLKAKVTEIIQRELEVKRINRKLEGGTEEDEASPSPADQAESVDSKSSEPSPSPDDAEQKAKSDQLTKSKEATLELVNLLREQKAGIAKRTIQVLDAFEDKGGEPEEMRKYVTAVSGAAPKLDAADVGATWIAVRGWLISEEGGIIWAKNILLCIGTLIVAAVLSRIVRKATLRAMGMAKSRSDILKNFMSKFAGRSVFVVGLIVAMAALDVPVSPLLAAIGGAALVIGLALQGALSNFASGIMILFHHPFDVGDVIEAAGISGTVEGVGVLSTQVRSFDNKLMLVPNNSIWGDVITNVTGVPTRRIDLTFGIGYNDDIAKAHKLLEDIVSKHELVLKDPAPVIRLHELADSSVNFIVRPWSKTSDYWAIYWDITRTVKERFDAEGISIPFPQRDVHLYQEGANSAAAAGGKV